MYATVILKHSYWLIDFFQPIRAVKSSESLFYTQNFVYSIWSCSDEPKLLTGDSVVVQKYSQGATFH